MNLLEYLKQLTAPQKKEFAARCGTSIGFLRLISYGVKPCSPELAVSIDRESGGAVSCKRLCPQAVMDWEYIEKKFGQLCAAH